MKEALYQRGIFSSPLMRRPVLPLTAEEKAQVAKGVKGSGRSKVTL